MVEFFGSWIEGIAITVIIASIFEMILPNGNMKKYIKIVLGIYVVFSIISPFVDSEELYSLDVSDVLDEYSENITTSSTQNSVENDLNEIYISTFEDEIISSIEEQGYNVDYCNVDAVFDTVEDDAGIKEIYIKLNSKKDTNSENSITSVETVEKVEINVGNTANEESTKSDISEDDVKELKSYLSEYFEVDKKIISIEY